MGKKVHTAALLITQGSSRCLQDVSLFCTVWHGWLSSHLAASVSCSGSRFSPLSPRKSECPAEMQMPRVSRSSLSCQPVGWADAAGLGAPTLGSGGCHSLFLVFPNCFQRVTSRLKSYLGSIVRDRKGLASPSPQFLKYHYQSIQRLLYKLFHYHSVELPEPGDGNSGQAHRVSLKIFYLSQAPFGQRVPLLALGPSCC